MEGSAAVAPAAADAAGEVQVPAEQAAPVADPGQVTPDAQTDPNSPEARLAAAEKRAQEAEAQLAAQQQQGPADLLSALEGDEDLGLSPEDLAAFQNGQQPGEDAQATDAQVQEFENYLKELVQQQVSPIEEARATEQIQKWQDAHPDVKPGTPIFNELLATMETLGSQYGEAATKDVSLINLAYTAAKAKEADAGATPAEAAANQGASIETQAGQTQTGEFDEEQDYRDKLLGGKSSDGAGFR